MSKRIHCDIAVIGAGSAGLSFASGATQLGAKVILVEFGKMGGDCLNYGCVPSKSLLAAAKSYYHAKRENNFVVESKKSNLDFSKVMKHVHSVIDKIAEHDSVARFESLGVKVIKGKGTFLSKKELQVNNDVIIAKYFVIATGSSPFIPPVKGLNTLPYLTNETIFNLNSLPSHLLVIGGGPIGCELAQAFAMLGAHVSLIEAEQILAHDDPQLVEIIRQRFKEMNIKLFEHSKVIQVEEKQQIEVVFEKKGNRSSIEGSHLLVAVGRVANTLGLGLENADVSYSSKGIEVNQRLQTSNKRIYAIGDVVGHYQFTHLANYHAGIAIRSILFWMPAKVDYRAFPWVTYTAPELAHVGVTEKEAKKKRGVQITKFAFKDNDRAQTEDTADGLIKVISDTKGRILGASIVGEHAGELILPWVIAIRDKKTLRVFTDSIIPYPTLSEISKQVAGEFYKPKLFSKWVRRMVRFLLKLS